VCEVKLVSQMKSNPVDPFRPPGEDDSLQFFQGAERAFAQPELVRATLRKLATARRESGDAPDAEVASTMGRLRLEAVGPQLFRASYKDRPLHHEKSPLAAVLATHVQIYVRSEIDKSLREFNAKVEFLRDQMATVEKELAGVDAEKARFREANANSLPEDAAQTQSSRFQLQSRQAELTAQIRRLEGELDATRKQLQAETPLAQARFQSAQVYRDSLADINRKLAEAYARGLADGHPDVQRLKAERERTEGLIASEMKAPASAMDRESNVNYQSLRNRVDGLQAQLRGARADLADTQSSLGRVRQAVGDLPRVEQRLADLTRQQETSTRLRAQLFERLKQAELQLNLERVSAESRYDISPTLIERPKRSVTLALRCGLGVLAGLLIAAAVIAFREGRRVVAEALAGADKRPQASRT
jgi:uncharacterized protein involved in exopolysaccharide biosynthesis